LMACCLNSTVYSCFGIFCTFRPSGVDANHRPLEDEIRGAPHYDVRQIVQLLKENCIKTTLKEVRSLLSKKDVKKCKFVLQFERF